MKRSVKESIKNSKLIKMPKSNHSWCECTTWGNFRMFKSLSKKGINILVISTSEIKISVLIKSKNVKKAVVALHKEFNLEN